MIFFHHWGYRFWRRQHVNYSSQTFAFLWSQRYFFTSLPVKTFKIVNLKENQKVWTSRPDLRCESIFFTWNCFDRQLAFPIILVIFFRLPWVVLYCRKKYIYGQGSVLLPFTLYFCILFFQNVKTTRLSGRLCKRLARPIFPLSNLGVHSCNSCPSQLICTWIFICWHLFHDKSGKSAISATNWGKCEVNGSFVHTRPVWEFMPQSHLIQLVPWIYIQDLYLQWNMQISL